MELQVEKPGRVWHLVLLVGATAANEAIVQEECSLEPAPALFPLHELPNLLSFCEHFTCYDIDGMRSGVAYTVHKTRSGELRTFLHRPSDERRLPIVLVTPNPDRTFPLDYRKLAQLLCGIAHVMYLNPRNYWKNADVSEVHSCLGGTVRLYRPGYSVRDAKNVHPYYQPQNDQLNPQDKLELLDKNIAFLPSADHHDSLIEQLVRRRQEDQYEKQLQKRLCAWQEQFARAQVQPGLGAEFLADYESTLAENDRLKSELTASQDEVRRLRFELQKTRAPAVTPSTTESGRKQYVTLSRRAADTLHGLDPGERELITTTLLRKLTSEALRDNQSEVCPLAKRGTFYIYPRKQTNGGRRIIYMLQGQEVRVCEIYASHDNYQHARDKGWKEADYQETRIWSDNGHGSEQLEMGLQH